MCAPITSLKEVSDEVAQAIQDACKGDKDE